MPGSAIIVSNNEANSGIGESNRVCSVASKPMMGGQANADESTETLIMPDVL